MKLEAVPLSVPGDFTWDVERVRFGALMLTEVSELSAPIQLLTSGVIEYLQVPAGTEVSVQLVPEAIAEQVPELIDCCVVPVL
jgi:hypothetical protein